MTKPNLTQKTAAEIAYLVVPKYKTGKYPCHGVYAKQWQAAYDAALLALAIADNDEMIIKQEVDKAVEKMNA